MTLNGELHLHPSFDIEVQFSLKIISLILSLEKMTVEIKKECLIPSLSTTKRIFRRFPSKLLDIVNCYLFLRGLFV